VVVDVATFNDPTQYTLTIAGDATSGIFDDSKYQLAMSAAATTALTISTDYVTVRNLQITAYTGGTISHNGISIGTASSVTIRNCLIQDFIRTASTYSGISMAISGETNRLIYNNALWNCFIGIYVTGTQATAYNNTINGCTQYGIRIVRTASVNVNFQNNLIASCGTNDSWRVTGTGGTYTTGKNYTDDPNSPDVGCANATITFVNAGGEDFHLDASMAGTLLGNDLSGTFTVDIDNDVRSSWYAGFDELAALPGGGHVMNIGLNDGLNEGLE